MYNHLLQSHIGPALIPPATLSVFGKSPPPPATGVLSDLDLQGSSGVLTATILNNLFSNPAEDGNVTEETDTSLYDYENAKRTMQKVRHNKMKNTPPFYCFRVGGDGEDSHSRYIGGALLPGAAFTAVPFVHSLPTPTLLRRQKSLGLSSALLNSSILGRMFGTPSPSLIHSTNRNNASSTGSDLFSVVSAREIAHSPRNVKSTFGSREFSNGLSKLAPPQGFGDEDDDSENDRRGTYQSDRSFQVDVEINPAYSGLLRSSQRQASSSSRTPSPSNLRRSGQQLEDSGSLHRSSLLRSSAGSPTFSAAYSGTTGNGSRKGRAARRSLEERIESQLIDKSQSSLQSSIEKTLTRVSTDLSYSGSLRMNTLREQNNALVEKQKYLEQQLVELRQLQERVMSKLGEEGLLVSQSMDRSSQEMGSTIQETQRSTENTLDKQQELIMTLKEQVKVSEESRQEVEEINKELRMELVSMCRMASARDEGKSRSTQFLDLYDSLGQGGLVRKLKDERNTLQTLTVKLNAELSRYQAKFRPLTQTELDTLPGLPFTGPRPSWLINTKYLVPLLISYDDKIHDKELMVQEAEAALDQLRLQTEEVVKENRRLHIRLEQTDVSGPVGMTEWRTLQEQCKLVIEENQLLMEQVELQHRKVTDLTKTHAHEVTKLSKRVIVAEAERNQLEQEVSELRDKLGVMKREHNETLIECSSKLGINEHKTSLVEIKRTFEEEKSRHTVEIETVQTKIQNLATEKKSLSIKVQELKAENQTLVAEMKVLQKSYKKSMKKIQLLHQALQDTTVKEETAQRYLASIIKVAEKVTQERDSFVEAAHTEQRQKKAAINKVIEGNVAKNKAEEKLKLVKSKAVDKLEKAILRMKEQDDDFNKQRLEYEREIKHLRLLLRERQEMIDSALGDKRRVEDDLETMWQVTTADNQRMRETLEKSVNKLEEHGSLRVTMAQLNNDKDAFLCDSDIEK
ncbi:hypothetical protein LSH36_532g01045 [Paralvinella palmiformis]|uniref:Centrosomal protein of 89 kDa n=1 Tax=Paralvinella palmiformis TaxID=53620 RepID=A0AAD9MVZ7_9ANNE|nr:hypothetical protein LSH36_532g01045 [Paralvinella palmiformis]